MKKLLLGIVASIMYMVGHVDAANVQPVDKIKKLKNDALGAIYNNQFQVFNKNFQEIQEQGGLSQNFLGHALLAASQKGNILIAEMLVDNGALVDFAQPESGLTPLMVAAAHDTSGVAVQFLLERKADVTIKNKQGKTFADINPTLANKFRALYDDNEKMIEETYVAAENGNLDLVKKNVQSLELAKSLTKDVLGKILWYAAKKSPKVVEFIIEEYKDVPLGYVFNDATPLIRAAQGTQTEEIASSLLGAAYSSGAKFDQAGARKKVNFDYTDKNGHRAHGLNYEGIRYATDFIFKGLVPFESPEKVTEKQ